jgi:hypothetical protein
MPKSSANAKVTPHAPPRRTQSTSSSASPSKRSPLTRRCRPTGGRSEAPSRRCEGRTANGDTQAPRFSSTRCGDPA